MTKVKIFFTIVFFSIYTNVFAQTTNNGIVEYESKISERKVTNYLSKKREQLKKKMKVETFDKVYLSSKVVRSTLIFSNKEAVFKVNKKINLKHNNIAEQFISDWSGGSKIYYSNALTQYSLEKNCETLGECFIIYSKFKEWKLTQETKKIAGYLCYKAIRFIKGRKGAFTIIAWYTNSIPVNFGPKAASGLPGLILELEEPSITFRVKKIILNPKEKIKIQKPSNGIKITEEEYKKKVKKIADKIFGKVKR